MHTSSAAVQNDHEAPQTEVDLRNSPNKLHWESADQVEIDTLFGIPALAEVAESSITIPRRIVWRTKFVGKLKIDLITRKQSCRLRLVRVGPRQEQGLEFEKREVPTPLWFTVMLLLIAECTVSHPVRHESFF